MIGQKDIHQNDRVVLWVHKLSDEKYVLSTRLTVEDCTKLEVPDSDNLAYVTLKLRFTLCSGRAIQDCINDSQAL